MPPIRRLVESDRNAVKNHLLGLGNEAILTRFMEQADPFVIEKYASKINFDKGIILGIDAFDGTICGLAEVLHAPGSKTGEMAFSISPAFRHKGLGRVLAARAVREARNAGLKSLQVCFFASNSPMKKLASSMGMTLNRSGSDMDGDVPIPPADFKSTMGATADEIAARGLRAVIVTTVAVKNSFGSLSSMISKIAASMRNKTFLADLDTPDDDNTPNQTKKRQNP